MCVGLELGGQVYFLQSFRSRSESDFKNLDQDQCREKKKSSTIYSFWNEIINECKTWFLEGSNHRTRIFIVWLKLNKKLHLLQSMTSNVSVSLSNHLLLFFSEETTLFPTSRRSGPATRGASPRSGMLSVSC